MKRSSGLKQSGFKTRGNAPKTPSSPIDQAKAQKAALQRKTLRILEKAKQEAAQSGVELSEWEGDFLDSVSERVKTYGRAFADPDLGATGGTLSLRQGLKLREIRKKVKKSADTDA